jgi:hypothetical protein
MTTLTYNWMSGCVDKYAMVLIFIHNITAHPSGAPEFTLGF